MTFSRYSLFSIISVIIATLIPNSVHSSCCPSCTKYENYTIGDCKKYCDGFFFFLSGATMNLTCSACENFTHNPDDQMEWTLSENSTHYMGTDRIHISESQGQSFLIVKNVSQEFFGAFTCNVSGKGYAIARVIVAANETELRLTCNLTFTTKYSLECEFSVETDQRIDGFIVSLKNSNLTLKSCPSPCKIETDIEPFLLHEHLAAEANVSLLNDYNQHMHTFISVKKQSEKLINYFDVATVLSNPLIEERFAKFMFPTEILSNYVFEVRGEPSINYRQNESEIVINDLRPFLKYRLYFNYTQKGTNKWETYEKELHTPQAAPEFPLDVNVTCLIVNGSIIIPVLHHLKNYSESGSNFRKVIPKSFKPADPSANSTNIIIEISNDFSSTFRAFTVILDPSKAPQNVCQFKHKITWNPQEMVVTYLVFACKSSYEDLCMMPKSFVKLRGNISTYEGDMNNGAAHAIAACYEDGCSILKLTRECATENFLILMVRILIFIAVLLVSLKLSLNFLRKIRIRLKTQRKKQSQQEESFPLTEIKTEVNEEDEIMGMLTLQELRRKLVKNGDFLVDICLSSHHESLSYTLVTLKDRKFYYIRLKTDDIDQVEYKNQVFTSLNHFCNYYKSNKIPVCLSPKLYLKKFVPNQLVFSRNDVQLSSKLLGEGVNGKVWKGKLKGEKVVALKFGNNHENCKLLQEAQILKCFNHPNVIKMWGIGIHNQDLGLALEFCDGGNLKSFLKDNPTNNNQKKRFCIEAASGMDHIRENNYIHGDLAARNCLLSSKGSLKICDFGMAMVGPVGQVKDAFVSYKWTAPECLNLGIYSTKSDIWSYGVLVWEIYSNGSEPYVFLPSDITKYLEYIDNDNRLIPPTSMPKDVISIMLDCWKSNISLRPTFSEIIDKLSNDEDIITQIVSLNS